MMNQEHELLQALIRDADMRRGLWIGLGGKLEPLLVWTDFDRSYLFTELDPTQLKPWDEITEYLKIQLGFLVALELGGYSFTINLPAELEDEWRSQGRNIGPLLQRRLRRELNAQGVGDLAYAYAVETRSRSTRSRTHIHLHGYFIAENPVVATRFFVGAEGAFRRFQGRTVGTKSDLRVEQAYDVDTGDGRGRGRWPSYSLKAIHRWDARVPGRRVFMSRSLTQAAREFWELLRTDVVTDGP